MVIIWCLDNMVDGTFLQVHIQMQRLVQYVTCEQMYCRAKVGYTWVNFPQRFFLTRQAVCEVSPTQPFILTGSINRVPTCPASLSGGR